MNDKLFSKMLATSVYVVICSFSKSTQCALLLSKLKNLLGLQLCYTCIGIAFLCCNDISENSTLVFMMRQQHHQFFATTIVQLEYVAMKMFRLLNACKLEGLLTAIQSESIAYAEIMMKLSCNLGNVVTTHPFETLVCQ